MYKRTSQRKIKILFFILHKYSYVYWAILQIYCFEIPNIKHFFLRVYYKTRI